MTQYYWLINKFLPSTTFYKECANGTYKEVDLEDDDIFGDNIDGVYSSLDDLKPRDVTLTVQVSGNGFVTGDGVYPAGSEVTLTATPIFLNVFVRWYNAELGIDVYENPYTFTLNDDLELMAVFRRTPKPFEADANSDTDNEEDEVVLRMKPSELKEKINYISPDTLQLSSDIAEVNNRKLYLFKKVGSVTDNKLFLDTAALQTYVAVTPLYDELIKRFKTLEGAQAFLEFMDRLLTEGLFEPLSGTTPYIDVDFSLTSSQSDIGVVTPYAPHWMPNKKYFIGDIVTYNNETWQLVKCDIGTYDLVEVLSNYTETIINGIEDGTYLYRTNLAQIPNSIYRYFSDRTYKSCIYGERVSGITKYYFVKPYYAGSYDEETYICSFDTTPKKHWDNQFLENKYTKYLHNDTEELHGITESKLAALVRQKISVDDSGQTLPFIVDDSGSSNTEMVYRIGITNEVSNNEKVRNTEIWHGDYLESVTFITSDGEDSIMFDSEGSITADDVPFDDGTVQFVYYIGATIEIINRGGISSKTVVPETGVKYEETWNFSKEVKNCRYDGDSATFDYINIYPGNYILGDINNIDINGKTPIYSNITYYKSEILKNQLTYCQTFKHEDLMGVQFINPDVDANIQRGTAASYERHNILGEIKTFDDLENYRNNFFKI